jgi:restriction endonuclease S subunit
VGAVKPPSPLPYKKELTKMKIKDIGAIQIGYLFRDKIQPDMNGVFQIIQIKDIADPDNFTASRFSKINMDRDPERYLVKKGDVLFLSRGQRNIATAINVTLENTIVPSYFFILKIHNEQISPEYIAWYINQPFAQKYLQSNARRGTHMPMVGRSEFEEMPIDIPPLEIQHKIVGLNKLRKQESRIIKELEEKRTQLIQTKCLKAVKHFSKKKRGA